MIKINIRPNIAERLVKIIKRVCKRVDNGRGPVEDRYFSYLSLFQTVS